MTADELRGFLTYDPATGIFRWLVARGQKRIGDIAGRINNQESASVLQCFWCEHPMKIQTPKAKDADHLDYIRNLPCLVCGDNTATEAAHVRSADARAGKKITGIGIKPRDCWTVPLCSRHHRRQHEVGEAHFWSQWGIDPVFKAMALWIHSGDIEAGEEIAKTR